MTYRNKRRGLDAEHKIAEWLEVHDIWVDRGKSKFSSGQWGYPDIVALDGNHSYGIEAKSTRFHFIHKKKGILQVGRIKFDSSAVYAVKKYCDETGLIPIVLALIRIKNRNDLVWYYPFDYVLQRCTGRLGFTISLYDLFEDGLPAKYYFFLPQPESSYRDLRNYVRRYA